MAGDCILIELEHPDCILIDCGYKTTYNTELRPLLLRLNAEGYRISLMIISHIDRDHIEGAVHFLRENGVWGDRIFEKCGIGRDEGGDDGKTLEMRGKRRLSARDGGANYQQS